MQYIDIDGSYRTKQRKLIVRVKKPDAMERQTIVLTLSLNVWDDSLHSRTEVR